MHWDGDRVVGLTAPDPPLNDGDLVLRRPRPDDLDEVLATCQDPLIQEMTLVPSPYRRVHAEEFLRLVDENWAEGTGASFFLSDATGTYRGSIGVRFTDHPPSIGYLVAPAHRGQGLARRAVVLVTRWAHDELGLDTVVVDVFAHNAASRAVARAAGYVESGPTTCEQRGVSVPSLRYVSEHPARR